MYTVNCKHCESLITSNRQGRQFCGTGCRNSFYKLPLSERLYAKRVLRGDCWEWSGHLAPNGYGRITVTPHPRQQVESVHRVSWNIHHGDIPKGLCVLHKCDNKKCFNPEHLFLGTHQDNMDDKVKKGRQSRATGNAKLSSFQVLQIREFLSMKIPMLQISKRMGIGEWSVAAIRDGLTYRSVR